MTRQGGIAQDTAFLVFDSDGNQLDWSQVDGRTYSSMVPPKETGNRGGGSCGRLSP